MICKLQTYLYIICNGDKMVKNITKFKKVPFYSFHGNDVNKKIQKINKDLFLISIDNLGYLILSLL